MSKDTLFKEFDAVSLKAWKQQIQVDLKGADYNETLVWDSPDGIKVKPIYHGDDLINTPSLRAASPSQWFVGQSIYAGNAEMANKKAKNALERGAESIVFKIHSEDIKISRLLANIDLTAIPIYFELQFISTDYVKQIWDFVKGKNGKIHLNIDIIGNLARTGNWYYNLEKDHGILNQIISQKGIYNDLNLLGVDIGLYQNSGANKVQQLAYALAHVNEYLNHLKNNNIDYGGSVTFKIAIDTNYFFEIAKIRALRQLWTSLISEYDLDIDCHIVASPSLRNKTLYDYNVNLLRTATESMSAILGGANMVNNLAYDSIYHKDNEFGERIARNQLLVLKGESYFDKVSNPVDGSYYIESITEQLAEKALTLFKQIEAGGGFLKQLKSHIIQRKIRESAKKEQLRFENGEKVLVGSNKYPNELDKMKGEIELYPFVKTRPRKTLLEPIVEKRLAEVLEQNRLDHE